MKKYLNYFLVMIVTLLSCPAFSEVYQCVIENKTVFQQTPCELIEVVPTSCDSNHDYLNDVGPIDTSFDNKYCFYLQLDQVDAIEKARLMQAYQEKKRKAQSAYNRQVATNKINNVEVPSE